MLAFLRCRALATLDSYKLPRNLQADRLISQRLSSQFNVILISVAAQQRYSQMTVTAQIIALPAVTLSRTTAQYQASLLA